MSARKLALEALEYLIQVGDEPFPQAGINAIAALKTELAQAVEPVAFQSRYIDPEEGPSLWSPVDAASLRHYQGRSDYETRPLYAAPQEPAAPDVNAELLEELENCADLLSTCFPDAPINSCIGVAIVKARAAIAKAEAA